MHHTIEARMDKYFMVATQVIRQYDRATPSEYTTIPSSSYQYVIGYLDKNGTETHLIETGKVTDSRLDSKITYSRILKELDQYLKEMRR
jgi:hypothetical protein